MTSDLKEERKMLLETWLDIEKTYVSASSDGLTHLNSVKEKLPIKVKKRRPIAAADGSIN